jgi:hypothetical protein
MSDSNVLRVQANVGVICAELTLRMMQGKIGNPETVTVLRHHWISSDLHTVTRAMKRQAVEDLLVIFDVRAQLWAGMSDVSACFSLCTSQEPPLSYSISPTPLSPLGPCHALPRIIAYIVKSA